MKAKVAFLLIVAWLCVFASFAGQASAWTIFNGDEPDFGGIGGDGVTIGEGSDLVPGPFVGGGDFVIVPTPAVCDGQPCFGDDGSGDVFSVGPWVVVPFNGTLDRGWDPQPVVCFEDEQNPGDAVCV